MKNKTHSKASATKRRDPPAKRGRPRKEVAPELPTYDSMKACAAATGIPLETLKLAKRKGCEGFRSTRVSLGPVLRWIFSQGDESDINWSAELNKYKAQREEIRLAQDRAEVIPRSDVVEGVGAAMGELFGSLDRVLLSELPPVLKGLSEKAIRAKCENHIENLKEKLRHAFAKISS